MGLALGPLRPPPRNDQPRCWAEFSWFRLWAYAPSTALLVLGAFLIQFMVQGAWGIIPAHLSELSPDSVRGFLPGFAYQCGVLVASSVVYIEAVFAKTMSYATAMALTAVTVFRAGRDRGGVRQGAQRSRVWSRRLKLRSDGGRSAPEFPGKARENRLAEW